MNVIAKERKSRKKVDFKLNFFPNLDGVTPLHLCIQNAYSKAAESVLIEIGQY